MHGLTASAILKLIIRCTNQGYNLSVKIYYNPYLRKKKNLQKITQKIEQCFFQRLRFNFFLKRYLEYLPSIVL